MWRCRARRAEARTTNGSASWDRSISSGGPPARPSHGPARVFYCAQIPDTTMPPSSRIPNADRAQARPARVGYQPAISPGRSPIVRSCHVLVAERERIHLTIQPTRSPMNHTVDPRSRRCSADDAKATNRRRAFRQALVESGNGLLGDRLLGSGLEKGER